MMTVQRSDDYTDGVLEGRDFVRMFRFGFA